MNNLIKHTRFIYVDPSDLCTWQQLLQGAPSSPPCGGGLQGAVEGVGRTVEQSPRSSAGGEHSK